jgi:hypothetical protein
MLPFEVLPFDGKRLVLDCFEVSYLASGRDLLRLGRQSGSTSPAIVVADPNFDLAQDAVARGQPDSNAPHFERLYDTRDEGERVAALTSLLAVETHRRRHGRVRQRRICDVPSIEGAQGSASVSTPRLRGARDPEVDLQGQLGLEPSADPMGPVGASTGLRLHRSGGGVVRAHSILGGLHHEYFWAAVHAH